MAESEDWRRQRAIQLGLEPSDGSTQSEPAHLTGIAGSRSRSSGAEIGGIGDGVYRMRQPYTGIQAVPEVVQHSDPSRHYEIRHPIRPPKAEPAADAATVAPQSRISTALAQIRRKRTWPYFAGAGLIAATAAGWFVEQQIGSARPERASAAITPARRSIAPAATIPAAQWVGSPDHSSSLRAASAINELPSCTEPALVDELRGVVTEQLRRSGLLRTGLKAPVEIAKTRVRIAEAGSSLTVCTAALRFRRPARKLASFDLDYAVRRLSGSPAQVVPLGLEHIVERIQTDDLTDQTRLALNGAGAVVARAPVAVAAASSASRQNFPAPSKIVVSKVTVTVPVVAPSERRVFATAAAPVAPPLDLLVRVPKVVHGCEQPATESVAITCSSPLLLALNVQVTAALAALDRPGNTVELARIKRHADQHFDRCTTASCVSNAYHYWLGALDRIRRYEAEFGSAGLDGAGKGRVDAQ